MRTLYFVFILVVVVFFITGSVFIWTVTRETRMTVKKAQTIKEGFFKVGRYGKTLILEVHEGKEDK
jgi:uncharacterized membrane protein